MLVLHKDLSGIDNVTSKAWESSLNECWVCRKACDPYRVPNKQHCHSSTRRHCWFIQITSTQDLIISLQEQLPIIVCVLPHVGCQKVNAIHRWSQHTWKIQTVWWWGSTWHKTTGQISRHWCTCITSVKHHLISTVWQNFGSVQYRNQVLSFVCFICNQASNQNTIRAQCRRGRSQRLTCEFIIAASNVEGDVFKHY